MVAIRKAVYLGLLLFEFSYGSGMAERRDVGLFFSFQLSMGYEIHVGDHDRC